MILFIIQEVPKVAEKTTADNIALTIVVFMVGLLFYFLDKMRKM